MAINIKQVTDKIIHVSCTTEDELAQTFMRFQECYENPEWRGKVFTRGQFMDWYGQKYGAYTYAHDWTGFNIPSSILEPFIRGLFDPLTPNEEQFLNLFKHRTDKFYIIGVQGDRTDTLDHEICHGLYHTSWGYKNDVNRLLAYNKKSLKKVYEFVGKMMYHPSVLDDEVHAYMSSGYEWLKDEGCNPSLRLHKELRAIKKKYYNPKT